MCDKYFGSIVNEDVNIDALDAYLSSPTSPSVVDPLQHWNALDPKTNPFAQFALDFLCAPGNVFYCYSLGSVLPRILAASTDVERAFSSGGLHVSRLRHSLSDQSTRAATVLGSWASIEGLIPSQELLEMIRKKGPGWRETESLENEQDEGTQSVLTVESESEPDGDMET